MHSLLTKREKQIFTLLIQSYTTKDIAEKLYISEKTVRNHISNVIQKLGVESRIQAVLELMKMKEIDFYESISFLSFKNKTICIIIVQKG